MFEKPSAILARVRVPCAARDFFPRVNFSAHSKHWFTASFLWRKVPESDARSLEEGVGKRCSECDQYPNLSEGADRVGGQLCGDKECPFSDLNAGIILVVTV